ncbi:hypothetical protein B0H16DRAFT_1690176 [Mycena metata]|uniref:Uncharacterized protein n=1 Tax=Mycena metata TaxID=1033252 RepID=A0AAD7J3P4_9AGAR|nr:hypothetical protein B0H16DRAFT_1690176 [Mycena metata]
MPMCMVLRELAAAFVRVQRPMVLSGCHNSLFNGYADRHRHALHRPRTRTSSALPCANPLNSPAAMPNRIIPLARLLLPYANLEDQQGTRLARTGSRTMRRHRKHRPSPFVAQIAGTYGAARAHASSISSNPHISPSPRMDVARSFENMTFRSPNWGTDPLPRDRPTSPNMQKPQSPPRLLMPDDEHAVHGAGGFTPPTINAPEGDGVGPRLHIVPATPVSGGGAGSTGAGPSFQSGLETLHQGTSLGGGGQASQSGGGGQGGFQDEYSSQNATQSGGYDFRGGGDPSSSSSSANANNNNANSLPFLSGRQRRKSDTAWDESGGGGGNSSFIGQMGNIGSALDDSGGDPHAHVQGSPHCGSFGSHTTTHPHQAHHPQLNAGFSFGPPAGSAGLGLGLSGGGDNGFLSPEFGLMGAGAGGGLRRAKSDSGRMGMGHRGSRSEDLRLPSTNHLDVDFGGRGGGGTSF